MATLSVLTKTYAPDLEYFQDLRVSVERFAPPSSIHTVVVDDHDVSRFRRFASPTCHVVAASSFLPTGFMKVPSRNVMINIRHPWPPVRGWVSQQVVKLAAAARSQSDLVLLMDSDVALIRPLDPEMFVTGSRPHFLRVPGGVTPDMERHVIWHRVARTLLGLPPAGGGPLNDYVDAFNVWSPHVVRAMCARITHVTGKAWETAFASQLHISEFILYGVFLDEVLGMSAAVHVTDRMPSHNYWDATPLDLAKAYEFVDQARETDVALMISAKSRTPLDVRRRALTRAQVD